ncbi:MAG: hypothetical protein ABL967_10700 [Bryobacteraceae bacterium]
MLRKHSGLLLLVPLLLPAVVSAQSSEEVKQILERLERLERENQNLAAEVRALRTELSAKNGSESQPAAAPEVAGAPVGVTPAQPDDATPEGPPLAEQVAVNTRQIADLSQTKVESSQKLPVTLSGIVLFNAFINGRANAGEQYPMIASTKTSIENGGASPSQTIIGLTYQGHQIWGGARLNASAFFDLWGGNPNSSLDHTIRLRVATISADWKNQSLMVGQDKPIIAPRDPTSLAQVAFSPLTSAGNLWLWQPQIRFEQRFHFGETAGLKAQAGLYQTSEPIASAGEEYGGSLAVSRPALEGRFEFWKEFAGGARFEIAPGFHTSNTHVDGLSVPSRLFSIDWLLRPVRKLEVTGTFFGGKNTAGIGGLRQGFTFLGEDHVVAVRAAGGWLQVSYQATSRLSFQAHSGQESNRAADLLIGGITRNLAYAGNVQYKIASNVVLAFEASQVRTKRVSTPERLNNHYDFALAYLF